MDHQKSLVVGIGDFACQSTETILDIETPDTDVLVCHYKSQTLENTGVSRKIKLDENLVNFTDNSINSQKTLKDLFPHKPGIVFLITDLKDEWSRKATALLGQLAKGRDQITIAIIPQSQETDEYYTRWEIDPGKFIDAVFPFERKYLGLNNKDESSDKNQFVSFARNIIKTFTNLTNQSGTFAIDPGDLGTIFQGSSQVLMGKASADGENRALDAIRKAFKNKMDACYKALLFLETKNKEVIMDEVGEITDYLQSRIAESVSIIWGSGVDQHLENKIRVTIITGK